MINIIFHRMTALIGVISSKEQYAFIIGVSNMTPYLGHLAYNVCNFFFFFFPQFSNQGQKQKPMKEIRLKCKFIL